MPLNKETKPNLTELVATVRLLSYDQVALLHNFLRIIIIIIIIIWNYTALYKLFFLHRNTRWKELVSWFKGASTFMV